MKNFLLLSTAVIMPAMAYALPSDFPTYTHTNTPIELRSVSHISEIKLASVCFLGQGDCRNGEADSADNDYRIDTEKQCKNEGFVLTSCIAGSYPQGICPYNAAYFMSCGAPSNQQKCENDGYSLNCGEGMSLDVSQSCGYDINYKKCVCTDCSGFNYALSVASAEGYEADGSCNSCGTIKYKRKNAECSGFKSCDCGGAVGASTCKSGSNILYNSCKECPTCDDSCSGSRDKNSLTCDTKEVVSIEKTDCGNNCYTCCQPGCNESEGDRAGACGAGKYVSSYDYSGPKYTNVSTTFHYGSNYGRCGHACWSCYTGQLYYTPQPLKCTTSDNIFWTTSLTFDAECIMSDGVKFFSEKSYSRWYSSNIAKWSSKENCETETAKLASYLKAEAVGGCRPTWNLNVIGKDAQSYVEHSITDALERLRGY